MSVWPENITEDAVARVTSHTMSYPPQYCAIDLTAGNSAASYPVYFYPSSAGVPQGPTNERYKTTHLLLRRIEATPGVGYTIGSPASETGRTASREGQSQVVLTKPYYFGVYQLTQQQWMLVAPTGTNESQFQHPDYRDMRPVEYVSYLQLRESGSYSVKMRLTLGHKRGMPSLPNLSWASCVRKPAIAGCLTYPPRRSGSGQRVVAPPEP